jgi:voltage-gated sodium channel
MLPPPFSRATRLFRPLHPLHAPEALARFVFNTSMVHLPHIEKVPQSFDSQTTAFGIGISGGGQGMSDQQKNILVRIRYNPLFETSMIVVIVFSALVTGIKTYPGMSDFDSAFLYVDYAITLIFLVEIISRFIADGRLSKFLSDPWNVFDTLIVLVSLIPIEHSNLVLIGRLIRIFRILRVISVIPELRFLITTLAKSIPNLSYLLLLMFIFFYIYGAIGATIFADVNDYLWGDIARAMLTLFRVMTFEDWTDVMYEVMEVHPWGWIYFLSFIFFSAFAFLNMLIAIVVDVMNVERERMATGGQGPTHPSESLEKGIEKLAAQIEELRKRL